MATRHIPGGIATLRTHARRRIATTLAAAVLATGSALTLGISPAAAAVYRYWFGISCQQVPGSSGTQTVAAFFAQRPGGTMQRLTVKNLSTGAEVSSAWYWVSNRVATHQWDGQRWISTNTSGVAWSLPSFNAYTEIAQVHYPNSTYSDFFVGSDKCYT